MNYQIMHDLARDHHRELLREADIARQLKQDSGSSPRPSLLGRALNWIGESFRRRPALARRREPECATC